MTTSMGGSSNSSGSGTDATGGSSSGGNTGSGGTTSSTEGSSSGGSAGAPDGSGGVGGTGATGGTTGTTGTGGTGGTQTVCDPLSAPSADACVITEEYGVFVHPSGSDEGGDGSQGSPYASLSHALTVAVRDAKRVYACATAGDFVESLVLDDSHDSLGIFGGFDCDSWAYDTALRAVIASPATSGLRITDTSDAHIENFSITVTNPSGNGTSSIAALLANTTDVTLRRVTVAAGDGRPGTNGVNGSPGAAGSLAGTPPAGRNANCNDNFQQREGPGWASESSCGSRGGNGGYTFAFSWGQFGGYGAPGTPDTNVVPPGTDNGGEGADWDTNTSASAGQPGSPGAPGTPGAAGPAIGTFSAQGYAAPIGGSGGDGHTGQGGGGGGSGVAFTCNGHGPSGGVGGMGGCGGTLGTGAQGGGASVALLSWNNQSLVLDACAFTAGDGGPGGMGGTGGNGGNGAAGSAAGSIGNPAVASIAGNGGRGGNGGNGGSGAGGAGGPSVALVHIGELPIQRNGTSLSAGLGGDAGSGGDASADPGAQGMSADVYQQP